MGQTELCVCIYVERERERKSFKWLHSRFLSAAEQQNSPFPDTLSMAFAEQCSLLNSTCLPWLQGTWVFGLDAIWEHCSYKDIPRYTAKFSFLAFSFFYKQLGGLTWRSDHNKNDYFYAGCNEEKILWGGSYPWKSIQHWKESPFAHVSAAHRVKSWN